MRGQGNPAPPDPEGDRMTTDHYAARYLHHAAGITITAGDLHANLGVIARHLDGVMRPGQAIPADLARRLDVMTDAVLVAERLVAELASEVIA